MRKTYYAVPEKDIQALEKARLDMIDFYLNAEAGKIYYITTPIWVVTHRKYKIVPSWMRFFLKKWGKK